MRISDWSSDVCSSDLLGLLEHLRLQVGRAVPGRLTAGGGVHGEDQPATRQAAVWARGPPRCWGGRQPAPEAVHLGGRGGRSDERRVGTEWVRTVSTGWLPHH